MMRLPALLFAVALLAVPARALAAAPPPSFAGVMAAAEKGDARALENSWNTPAVVDQVRAIGPDALIDYYMAVGRAFDRMHKPKQAVDAYSIAVDTIIEVRGQHHISLVEAWRLYGEANYAIRKYPDAIWALQQAADVAERALGPDDPLTRDLTRKADLYETRAVAAGVDLGGNADIPLPPPGSSALPPPPPVRAPFQTVEVFYATERKPTGSVHPATFFSGRRGPMVYGRATVSVPSHREVGEIPMPSVFTLTFRPDPEKHFILTRVDPISTRDGFFGAVGGVVAKSREKEAFVFIHGFNSSFEGGAMRAAQLAVDLKFDGAPILYSWPSRGDVFGYAEDARESDSDQEAQALADFLKDVAARTGAERITVIAHSMGNRPLINALQKIAPAVPGAPLPFDEIVMAAPDVGGDAFDKAWPRARQVGGRFTLYASSRDKALMMSAQINGMRRVGDAHHLVLADGMETVDTTAASNGLIGHDDFAGTALDDFRAVVWLSLAPDRRCVLQSGDAGHRWWQFVAGACPVDDFRAATSAARLAGGTQAALAEVDQEIGRSQGAAQQGMERMRAMLARIAGPATP